MVANQESSAVRSSDSGFGTVAVVKANLEGGAPRKIGFRYRKWAAAPPPGASVEAAALAYGRGGRSGRADRHGPAGGRGAAPRNCLTTRHLCDRTARVPDLPASGR
jgi:hypothetical protein